MLEVGTRSWVLERFGLWYSPSVKEMRCLRWFHHQWMAGSGDVGDHTCG